MSTYNAPGGPSLKDNNINQNSDYFAPPYSNFKKIIEQQRTIKTIPEDRTMAPLIVPIAQDKQPNLFQRFCNQVTDFFKKINCKECMRSLCYDKENEFNL